MEIIYCCDAMRNLLETYDGYETALHFKSCPYCEAKVKIKKASNFIENESE